MVDGCGGGGLGRAGGAADSAGCDEPTVQDGSASSSSTRSSSS